MTVQRRFNLLAILAIQAVTVVWPNRDLLDNEGFAVRIQFISHRHHTFPTRVQSPTNRVNIPRALRITNSNGYEEKKGPTSLTEDGPFGDPQTQTLTVASVAWLCDASVFIDQASRL